MKQKLFLILSVLSMFTVVASQAHAAKIVLKSGLFFNGEIKKVTAESITIQPKFGNVTEYPWDKVESIDGTLAADYRTQAAGASAEANKEEANEEQAPLPIAEGPGVSKPAKLKESPKKPIEIIAVENKSTEPVLPAKGTIPTEETEKIDEINTEEAAMPAEEEVALEESIPATAGDLPVETIAESNPEWENWRVQTRDYYVAIEKTVEDANVNFEDLRLQGISASNEEQIIAAIKDFRQVLENQIEKVKALTPPDELKDYHQALISHLEFMDRSQEELLAGNVDGANKFLQLSRESYVASKERLRDVFAAQGAPQDIINQMDVVLGEYRDALQADSE